MERVKASFQRGRLAAGFCEERGPVSEALGIPVIILDKWRKAWRFLGVLPTSSRLPGDGWFECRRAQWLLP
jgi:hypothetical protein